jgi:hypothetical protein
MLLNIIENNSPEIKEKMLENFDVGIVNSNGEIDKSINNEVIKNDPVYGIGMMNTNFLSKNKIDMKTQSNYKYIIHIDGNVNAYRLLTSFLTGSLILRVKSNYTSWFDHLIYAYDISDPSSSTENTHYIWIKEDFTNLLEVMEWCLMNDEKCKQIAQNALEFAREKSRKEYILEYISMILWGVNDKFASIYEKKTSSSIKSVSSYNPSSEPEEEQSAYEQPSAYEKFLQSQSFYKPEYNPLSLQQPQSPEGPPPRQVFVPQSPEGPPPRQVFVPQSPSSPPPGFVPQSPSSPPPGFVPPQQVFVPQTPPTPISPPPTPPTPLQGFTEQPALSPDLTDILTQLKNIKTDIEEIKEENKEGTTGGSTMVDNILDVPNTKEEKSEYIKGGNTKKIMLI